MLTFELCAMVPKLISMEISKMRYSFVLVVLRGGGGCSNNLNKNIICWTEIFKVGNFLKLMYQGFVEKYFLDIYLHSKA